jgi:hypothetical protein
MSEIAFEKVIDWLREEREIYQTRQEKFDYSKGGVPEGVNPDDHDYWIQQFESYIQRLPVFGLDTMQGKQAALKLAATAVALCEHLAETGILPIAGYPSGEIH